MEAGKAARASNGMDTLLGVWLELRMARHGST